MWNVEKLFFTREDEGIFGHLPSTLDIDNNFSSAFIAIEYIDNKKRPNRAHCADNLAPRYHIGMTASFTGFLVRLDDGKEWLG